MRVSDTYQHTLNYVSPGGVNDCTWITQRTNGDDCPEIYAEYTNVTPFNPYGRTKWRIKGHPTFDRINDRYPVCYFYTEPGRAPNEVHTLGWRFSDPADLATRYFTVQVLPGFESTRRIFSLANLIANLAEWGNNEGGATVQIETRHGTDGSANYVGGLRYHDTASHDIPALRFYADPSGGPDLGGYHDEAQLLRTQYGGQSAAKEHQIVNAPDGHTLTLDGLTTAAINAGDNIGEVANKLQSAFSTSGISIRAKFTDSSIYVVEFEGEPYYNVNVPAMVPSSGSVTTLYNGHKS